MTAVMRINRRLSQTFIRLTKDDEKKKAAFSRGIQVEQGDKTSLYDRMGYWDSSYKASKGEEIIIFNFNLMLLIPFLLLLNPYLNLLRFFVYY